MNHERDTENYFFGDEFDLKPIRTESSQASGSFPKKSTFTFDDSVPSTPLYSISNSPWRFNEGSVHSFDPFSRFDSFKSHDSGYFQPQETLARFDSKRRHTDYDHGHGFPSSDNSDPLALGPLRHHWTVKLQDEALIIGVPFSSVTLTLVMPEDSTLLVCFDSSAI